MTELEYSKEVVEYVKNLTSAGHNYSRAVVSVAISHGYSLPIAHRIVDAVLNHGGNDGKLYYQSPSDCVPCPEVDINGRKELDLGDAFPKVVFEQLAPRLVLLDGFMTPSECDHICSIAEPLMAQAQVMSAAPLKDDMLKKIRDADTSVLNRQHDHIVDIIEQRIARLTNWDIARGEAIQVQRYQTSGKFIPHHDFFGSRTEVEKRAVEVSGQRLATLIVYLKEPAAGGATYLANLGLKVSPRQGRALFFSYPDVSMRGGTLHGGDPVISGEKWILTKWFREKIVPS